MTEPLAPGKTVFLYDGEAFAVLVGAISLPLESRVQVAGRDYIVNNIRVGIRPHDFDLYYDCHRAEATGTVPSFLD
jgi:hypothetical protein